jgi:hypothetical protein
MRFLLHCGYFKAQCCISDSKVERGGSYWTTKYLLPTFISREDLTQRTPLALKLDNHSPSDK